MTNTEALLLPSVIEAIILISLVIASRKTGWIKEPSGDAVIGAGTAMAILGVIYAMVTGYLHGAESISYSVFGGFVIAFGISFVAYVGPGIIGIYTDPRCRRKCD